VRHPGHPYPLNIDQDSRRSINLPESRRFTPTQSIHTQVA
jgi:hypothetical protein